MPLVHSTTPRALSLLGICLCSTMPLSVLPCTVRAAEPASQFAPPPIGGELDPQYIDGSFGFGVRPFAGATLLRQKKVLSVADIEIVQFVRPEEKWSLTVRQTATTRPLDVKTMVEGITSSLAAQYKDVKQVRGEEARIASREGVRYAATFAIEQTQWLRQQAVIRSKPTEYFALVLVTPLADQAAAVSVFDRVVDSFQILRSEVIERRLRAALDRGTAFLKELSTGSTKLTSRLIPESFLRIAMAGKEIGFVRVRERKHARIKREGIEITEWGWLFKPDGTITHLSQEMLLTDDLTFESWKNHVLTIFPATDARREQVVLEMDSGIRQESELVVGYMPSPNSPDLLDKVLEVEKSYASAALHPLMPRLLNLSKAETYAFSSYNAERRGLVLRTFQVVGPTRITIGGASVRAIRLEDSEGLLPPINEIDVDDKGRIIRVLAGQLEMTAATLQEIESSYTDRVKAAQDILKRNPVREPTPVPRERPVPSPKQTPASP